MGKYKNLDLLNFINLISYKFLTEYHENVIQELKKENIINDIEYNKIKRELNIKMNQDIYYEFKNVLKYNKLN